MGCAVSKDEDQAAYKRLSQYRLASLADGLGLKTQPSPLELAEDGVGEGVAALVTMSPRQLHNVLFDGFYAPYMTNPDYLLLIDARPSRASYGRRRLLTARHHTDVDLDAVGLARYVHLVVYDQDGAGVDRSDSTLAAVVRHLQRRRLEPCALLGGLNAVDKWLSYMVWNTSVGGGAGQERQLALAWYPSILVEGTLWLGRMEQGTDPATLLHLNLTHLIHIGQTRPALAFPGMTCLTVQWPAHLKGTDLRAAIQGAASFACKAAAEAGRILILGDQGVNRSAAVAMAFLMQTKNCTLEDAYYYVKSLRSAVQPSPPLLQALSKMEAQLFGKTITDVEDLW